MPRYFFHTADGAPHTDDQGADLPDDRAARAAAVRFAGDVVSSEPALIDDGGEFRVRVVDESGARLFSVVVRSEH